MSRFFENAEDRNPLVNAKLSLKISTDTHHASGHERVGVRYVSPWLSRCKYAAQPSRPGLPLPACKTAFRTLGLQEGPADLLDQDIALRGTGLLPARLRRIALGHCKGSVVVNTGRMGSGTPREPGTLESPRKIDRFHRNVHPPVRKATCIFIYNKQSFLCKVS